MFWILMNGENAVVQCDRPDASIVLSPSGYLLVAVETKSALVEYLNDCPQRSVVLIHSSERLIGSFCHSAIFSATILEDCTRSG